MSRPKKTQLAKLRAANLEIKYLKKRLAEENEEIDVYAEALLDSCHGSVADAYNYVNYQRKKRAEAKRVAEMRRPNKPSKFTDIIATTLESARWRIATHAVFFAERPNRGGYITGLTVPE